MAYQAEIEKLEQRYAENPKQWFAALADAYRKQGEIDLAIEYVQGGIEDRPDYASAHIVLGRCYLDKDMDDDAARAFEQVLELDGENIIALKSLEEIAERRGDLGGARHWLNRLLEVDPMNEEAQECLERLGAAETGMVATEDTEATAAELGADAPAEDDVGSAPEDEPEPSPLEQTVTEEVVDPSSFGVEPISLDATMPMDPQTEEPEEESPPSIEPVGLERAEFGANHGMTERDAEAELSVEFGAEPEIPEDRLGATEPVEIETERSGSDSFFPDSTIDLDSSDVSEEPAVALEPIEIETEDTGVTSLLGEMPDDVDSEDVLDRTTADFETIEIETSEHDAISLVPNSLDDGDPWQKTGDTPSIVEPGDLEPASDDADSLVASGSGEFSGPDLSAFAAMPTEPVEIDVESLSDEAVTEVAEDAEEEIESDDSEPPTVDAISVMDAAEPKGLLVEEPLLVEEVVDPRASVPPTEEVDAVELEAIRAADEMASTPTVDSGVVEELEPEESDAEEAEADKSGVDGEEIEAATDLAEELGDESVPVEEVLESQHEDPAGSTEIDAVELERMHADDASGGAVSEEAEVAEAGVGAEDAGEGEQELDALEERETLPLIMPDDVGGHDMSEEVEPEPVVTETMAEVYAKQGLLDQAVEIYDVLVMQHAGDERLKGRLDELTKQARNSAQETRLSRFSVDATGGQSAVSYLQQLFSLQGDADGGAIGGAVSATALEEPPAEIDQPEPTPLDEAFEDDVSDAPGEPTVPAGDDVNLESVFDGGVPASPSEVRPPGGTGEGNGEPSDEDGVSFDEFYGSEASSPPPAEEEDAAEESRDDGDDDFKNWLDGLKT